MIYNFNLGIGWASSGVEYAQVYRAKLFREMKVSSKFIFTDLILHDNIQHLTQNIGLYDDEVIWLYTYFTDIKLSPTTFTPQQLEETFEEQATSVERNSKMIRYRFSEQNLLITGYFSVNNDQTIERVEFASEGKLIRKDYYTYTKVLSEYYAPKENKATVFQRRYFNENGSTAYEEIVDKENSIFRVGHNIFYSKDHFISYFVKCLKLQSEDIVIIDRAARMAQPILENKGDAKVGVVIHAEHYNINFENDQKILWNNFYEYQFTNHKHIDFFVTATTKQRQILEAQFAEYYGTDVKVYDIAVGSLESLVHNTGNRRPYSLVTASRLADEKHIDWIVKAVVAAQKNCPELTLDIYGKGKQETQLLQLIKDNHAEQFIQLKGHQDMSSLYKEYEAYISASTSEGFGLTLMEAVGSGLAMIGLDVPYGNQTFIKSDNNGVLIPYDAENSSIQDLKNGIIAVFKEDIQKLSDQSYRIASEYLTENIIKKWKKLIKEQNHES